MAEKHNVDQRVDATASSETLRLHWRRRATMIGTCGCIAVALAFVVYGLANAVGVCLKDGTYWSEQKLVAAAVRKMASMSESDPEMAMNVPANEAGVDAFLRSNPNCCGLDRTSKSGELAGLWTGTNAFHLELNYELFPKTRTWTQDKYYKKFLAFNSCGEFLKFEGGISTKNLEANH